MADDETVIDPTVYKRGLDISIDVNKLVTRFGILVAGAPVIPHEEIAACIGVPYNSPRYWRVVGEYRAWLFELPRNVATVVKPGQGLYAPTWDERVGVSENFFVASMGKIQKSAIHAKRIAATSLSDPIQRTRRDHLEKFTSRLFMEGTNAAKALKPAPPVTPKALPRRGATGHAG